MNYETITYEKADGVGTVTINRPKVLNALSDQVIGELLHLTADIENDPEVKVVVITGSGDKAFVAGADINELAQADGLGSVKLARKGQRLTRVLESLGKPVIAAVNGFALGGGCELAMACTLRIASDNAVFGQPEVGLGVIPGYGGTQRLTRLVGKGRALDMVLTGRNVDAKEALEMGLVNRVVPAAELSEATAKLAKTLMKKGPVALQMTMAAVNTGESLGMDDALAVEAHYFGVCAGTEDSREGLTAFVEKRKPEFKGK